MNTLRRAAILAPLILLLLATDPAAIARGAPSRDGVIKLSGGPVTASLYKVNCHYGSVAYEIDPENPERAEEQAARYAEWLFGMDGLVDSLLKKWYSKECDFAEMAEAAKDEASSAAERKAASALALRFLDKSISGQAARERKRAERSGKLYFAIGKKYVRPMHFQLFETWRYYQAISGETREYVLSAEGVYSQAHVPRGGLSFCSDSYLTETDLVNRIKLSELVAGSSMFLYGVHGGLTNDLLTTVGRHWLFFCMEHYYGASYVDPKLGIDIWQGYRWRGDPPILESMERGLSGAFVGAMFRHLHENRPDAFYHLVSIAMGSGGAPDAPLIGLRTFRSILGLQDQAEWEEYDTSVRIWMQEEVGANGAAFKAIEEEWTKGTTPPD